MLHRKLVFLSVSVALSCAGMEQQLGSSDLAQKVAQLSIISSKMAKGYSVASDFGEARDVVTAVRRSMHHDNRHTLIKNSSPRVVAALDSVLAQAQTTLADGESRFGMLSSQKSSLSLEEKTTLLKAQLISFKHVLQSLFASIDRDGEYYGDEPKVPLKRIVEIEANGAVLAGVEVAECYAHANDDASQVCDACKNCPQNMWCSACSRVDRKHWSGTPLLQNLAKRTTDSCGVDDALWYLHSRVGSTALLIDAYLKDEKASAWKDNPRAQASADMRKLTLQLIRLHGEMVKDALVAQSAGQSACNAMPSTGALGSMYNGLSSWNPLTYMQAKVGSLALNKTLGIDEKLLPLIDEIQSSFLRLSGFDKDSTFLLESDADVKRFALVCKKPLREQFLSPEDSKQLDLWVHAWKTQGIVNPLIPLVTNASPSRAHQEQPEEKVLGKV